MKPHHTVLLLVKQFTIDTSSCLLIIVQFKATQFFESCVETSFLVLFLQKTSQSFEPISWKISPPWVVVIHFASRSQQPSPTSPWSSNGFPEGKLPLLQSSTESQALQHHGVGRTPPPCFEFNKSTCLFQSQLSNFGNWWIALLLDASWRCGGRDASTFGSGRTGFIPLGCPFQRHEFNESRQWWITSLSRGSSSTDTVSV